jgi:hypothetical protein
LAPLIMTLMSTTGTFAFGFGLSPSKKLLDKA